MLTNEELVNLINTRLEKMRMSAAEASRQAVGNYELVRNITKRKHKPTVTNVVALLDVLGCDLVPKIRDEFDPEDHEQSENLPDIP